MILVLVTPVLVVDFKIRLWSTYLPILGITLQHQRVFRLADVPRILILDLLDILLSLYTIVLGESALMPLLQQGVS